MTYSERLRNWLAEYRQHAYVHGTFCADIAFDVETGTMAPLIVHRPFWEEVRG